MMFPLRSVRIAALACWGAITLLMLVYAAATGRLTFQLVPDSPSYLEYPFGSLPEALRSIRTPGYPALLRLVGGTIGIGAMPLVHLLLHATAAWLLIRELRQWGTPLAASWAAGLAVAFGSTPLDNLAIISTDAPAASVGVMVAVGLMSWVRRGQTLAAAIPTILAAVVAIAIRPAYLAIIPWIMIAGTLLLWRQSASRAAVAAAVKPALTVGLLAAVPIFAWVALRGAVVGDLAILPFGHQNLAGITVQLVSEDELLAAPGETGELAQEIVRAQARYEAAGRRLPEGDAGATMTLESRWDEYVWRIIVPAAHELYPNDSIASHRALAALNRDIISRFPLRYVRWLLLAARRAAWGTAANIVMHPIFLVCLAVAAVLELVRAIKAIPIAAPRSDAGSDVLFIVAISYFAINVAFVILTSPPLGRFADAAAIFIPAWLIMRATQYFIALRSSATAADVSAAALAHR